MITIPENKQGLLSKESSSLMTAYFVIMYPEYAEAVHLTAASNKHWQLMGSDIVADARFNDCQVTMRAETEQYENGLKVLGLKCKYCHGDDDMVETELSTPYPLQEAEIKAAAVEDDEPLPIHPLWDTSRPMFPDLNFDESFEDMSIQLGESPYDDYEELTIDMLSVTKRCEITVMKALKKRNEPINLYIDGTNVKSVELSSDKSQPNVHFKDNHDDSFFKFLDPILKLRITKYILSIK